MIRDVFLIASKDLRIERSSKVILSQVLPFSVLILVLFGIAISPDLNVEGRESISILEQIAPGLFWLAIVFSSILAVNRSFAIESTDGNFEALRMTGIDPSSVFIGKTIAIALQMLLLEIIVGAICFLLYSPPVRDIFVLFITILSATIAISSVGILYGGLTSGARSRDTLVPLLLLPALAPVLLVATRSTEVALFTEDSSQWGWTMLLGVFGLLYTSVGMLIFEPIMEDS